MTNHVERFHAALTVLAGHGHIKQRLIKAYEDNIVDINEDELPVSLKQPFADLRLQMGGAHEAEPDHHVTDDQRQLAAEGIGNDAGRDFAQKVSGFQHSADQDQLQRVQFDDLNTVNGANHAHGAEHQSGDGADQEVGGDGR